MQLHKCINAKAKNNGEDKDEEKVQEPNSSKMVHLEEFLENALLVLSGMGAFKICKKVLKTRFWFCRLKEILKKALNSIGSKSTNKKQPVYEEVTEEELDL